MALFSVLTILIMASCGESTKEDVDAVPETDEFSITPAQDANYPLEKINLPDGFKISVYAEVDNARSMAISPSGTIFVGNRSENSVYALKDTDGDNKADKRYVLATGLRMPNGVAYKDGDLYIAEVSKIHKISDVESKLANPGQPELIYDKFPTDRHHGWKFIAFGPDGKLYVPVGAPCNICKSDDEVYASITRMDPDGSNVEVYAHGVRNTVGFDWHPDTGELWFTDNGRDMLGDEFPPCELNRVAEAGQHFGYPYCHGSTVKDPEFGQIKGCEEFVQPAWNFGAHTAPLGMRFYLGSMFPSDYSKQIFVAQHGSWNRTSKIGYRIMLVNANDETASEATVFADGWMNDDTQEVWGRPVDVLELADGSLLVSDDFAGVVYRITYEG